MSFIGISPDYKAAVVKLKSMKNGNKIDLHESTATILTINIEGGLKRKAAKGDHIIPSYFSWRTAA